MFSGLLDPDPDPLVRGMDPDSDPAPDLDLSGPSKNSTKNLDSYCKKGITAGAPQPVAVQQCAPTSGRGIIGCGTIGCGHK
jgi:hypothetical protein